MTRIPFAYIHIHSRYSIQDSAAYIGDYVKKINHYNEDDTSRYQITGLNISDHGNMHGVVKHYQACYNPKESESRHIKALYGCEIYHAVDRQLDSDSRYHMVLIAATNEGLSNLYRLVSDAGLNRVVGRSGKIFTLSDHEKFQRYGKGIIATSACLGGRLSKLLLGDAKLNLAPDYEQAKKEALFYASCFDAFYLEVQPHEIPEQLMLNQAIIQLAQDTGLPLIMGVDAHYVDASDKEYHDILKEVAHLKPYNTTNYLYTPEELEQFCVNHQIPLACLTNTAVIADACDVELRPSNSRGLLPEFETPNGHNESSYLQQETMKAFMSKLSKNQITDVKTYAERLVYELDVICEAGFAGYFLILWDWFKACRQMNILMGKGRGSAAGSLVCYLLDITTVDPIKNGLLFERFLSRERLEYPDVDSDVSRDDRPRAIEYLLTKYGDEHVCQIITFSEYKLKNTIKAVNTAYGFVPPQEINEITTKIPPLINGEGVTYKLLKDILNKPDKYPDISAQEYSQCKQIMKTLNDLFKRYPEIEKAVKNLSGAIASQGIHAGGVVISSKELHENLPIMHAKGDTAVLQISQLAMEDLDFYKALKIDVLGLQTCTVIHNAMKLANLDWDWYDSEDFSDQAVYQMLRQGETTDVFQMSKHTPKQMIKDFACDSIELLTAINAGNRPGTLAKIDELGGKSMVELFAERTKNKSLIPKNDDRIDHVLEGTNGCLWYQEHCMSLGMIMAGYSLGNSDGRIRKVLAKKKLKEIPALKNEFIYGKKSLYNEDGEVIGISEEDSPLCIGCIRNGFSEEVAIEIFSIMEKFARYAFNKSHSFAYAAIAYKTAWLSCHYPVEYAVACMSTYHDNDKILATLMHCRKRGIKILPPDINKSDTGFTIEVQPDGSKAIRFGLAAIHGIGEKAYTFIIEARKLIGEVTSYDDFYLKYHDSTLLAPVMAMFTETGKRPQNPIKKTVDLALIYSGAFDEFEENRFSLYNYYMGVIRKGKDKDYVPKDPAGYIRKEKLALEKEYMGTYVSEHPLEPFPYTDLTHASTNQFVEIAGQVTAVNKARGRNGEFGKARIEIKDGTEVSLMFFDCWTKYKPLLKKGQIFVFSGRYNEAYNNIAVENVMPIVVQQTTPLVGLSDDLDDVDQILLGKTPSAPLRDDPLEDLFGSSLDTIFS